LLRQNPYIGSGHGRKNYKFFKPFSRKLRAKPVAYLFKLGKGSEMLHAIPYCLVELKAVQTLFEEKMGQLQVPFEKTKAGLTAVALEYLSPRYPWEREFQTSFKEQLKKCRPQPYEADKRIVASL
jgi:hypothetical protein